MIRKPTKSKVGAPTKLTDEVMDHIEEEISKWVPAIYYCATAGIGRAQYYVWISNGERDLGKGEDSLEAYFYQRVQAAFSKRIKLATAKITEGDKMWTSQAWLLERAHQASFSLNGGEIQRLADEIASLKEIMQNGKTNGKK